MARRFYKSAGVAGSGPFTILLDDRKLRTPLKNLLAIEKRPLAKAIAREWEGQGAKIDPSSMPFTRLANTATDRVLGREQQIVNEIVQFAGSDLVCYRASQPKELVDRQEANWDPVLQWVEDRLRARFEIVAGVIHREQPAEALEAVRLYLHSKSANELCGLHNLTTLTGSALLAIALGCERLNSEEGWAAAHVDEDWQIERWGRDEEAEERRARRRREFDDTIAFLSLAG